MNGIGLGAIMGGALQGWREGQSDYERAQILKQQQAEAQQRMAGQGLQQQILQDRVNRLGTTDQQADDEAQARIAAQQAQTQGTGLENAIRTHTISQFPVTDAQNAQAFNTQQQLRAQQLQDAAIHAQLEKLGVSKAQLQNGIEEAQRELGVGFLKGQTTGDWSGLASAWNSTIGATHGGQVSKITQNQDGSFTAYPDDPNAQPIKFQDQQHLLQTAASMTDPSIYARSLYQSLAEKQAADAARAKNPKNFSELIRGDDGTLGNIDLATGKYQPLADQSGQPLTGTLAGKTRAGVSNDAASQFYLEQIKNGSDSARALQATRQYMSAFHPTAKGPWQAGVSPAGGAGAQGTPAGSAQPAPAPAQAASGGQVQPGARVPGARQAQDGHWYVPDPNRPGKYLMVN